MSELVGRGEQLSRGRGFDGKTSMGLVSLGVRACRRTAGRRHVMCMGEGMAMAMALGMALEMESSRTESGILSNTDPC